MVEHAGFTQPVSEEENIRRLFIGLADADKKLATYNLRRDAIVDELIALGQI